MSAGVQSSIGLLNTARGSSGTYGEWIWGCEYVKVCLILCEHVRIIMSNYVSHCMQRSSSWTRVQRKESLKKLGKCLLMADGIRPLLLFWWLKQPIYYTAQIGVHSGVNSWASCTRDNASSHPDQRCPFQMAQLTTMQSLYMIFVHLYICIYIYICVHMHLVHQHGFGKDHYSWIRLKPWPSTPT